MRTTALSPRVLHQSAVSDPYRSHPTREGAEMMSEDAKFALGY
jgi:hypothetical protein